MNLNKIVNNKGKLKQFRTKGIETVEDLLNYFPRDYLDYSSPKTIKKSKLNENHAIIVTIKKVKNYSKVLKFIVEDSKRTKLEMVFFKADYLITKLLVGQKLLICGKLEWNNFGKGSYQMVNPDFYFDIDKGKRIKPIYSKIKGMSDKYLEDTIDAALKIYKNKEFLSKDIKDKYNLIDQKDLYNFIHKPKKSEDIKEAKRRNVFNELFRFAMIMNHRALTANRNTEIVIKTKEYMDKLLDKLSFDLTEDQLTTVNSIINKMLSGVKTSSLVQGDVGCGKTMVAIILMLVVAENGYQSAIMTPTNVLAQQHFNEIKELTKDFDIFKPVLLTSNLKTKEKRQVLEGIASGEYNLIIGTHSLVSKDVIYKDLGLGIIDEEHRFGVLQREGLYNKSKKGVHMVSMSATPIPRTLALTIHGEGTDVYSIKTMPSGRKPVNTKITTSARQSYNFLYKQIKEGRQVYIVCPLIEESDSEKLENVLSVEETYKEVTNFFKKYPEVKVGVITGNMKKEEVEKEILKFKDLEYNVIISTTIIEVGVNVPNASLIIIRNSERFGLAQLHQLRGRVGRGKYQSYCILLTDKVHTERLKIMEETSDGFLISESDLKLRGLGDLIGTQQSGENKAVKYMLTYRELYNELLELTKELLLNDNKNNMYKSLIEDYDLETESEKSMKQYNIEKVEPYIDG